jgi:hypothetical protein
MLEARSYMKSARTVAIAPIFLGLLVWASAGFADKSKSVGSRPSRNFTLPQEKGHRGRLDSRTRLLSTHAGGSG